MAGPSPRCRFPRPSLDGAYRSDTNGRSPRIGIRALGCASWTAQRSAVRRGVLRESSGLAAPRLGPAPARSSHQHTVAATAVNLIAFIWSLLVAAPLWANPSTGGLFPSSRHGACARSWRTRADYSASMCISLPRRQVGVRLAHRLATNIGRRTLFSRDFGRTG